MKKLTVKNPKWQARLDRIHGWLEFAFVATVVVVTYLIVFWALKERVF